MIGRRRPRNGGERVFGSLPNPPTTPLIHVVGGHRELIQPMLGGNLWWSARAFHVHAAMSVYWKNSNMTRSRQHILLLLDDGTVAR